MKQSLIKRIRNALSYDDFDDTPLVGNYFIKDNHVLEIDEIPLNDSFEVNYGVMGIDKSIEDSWKRMRRGGLLDDLSEDEKDNRTSIQSGSVIYDKLNKSFIITHDHDPEVLDQVLKLFRITDCTVCTSHIFSSAQE
jgi:hypothetical protein